MALPKGHQGGKMGSLKRGSFPQIPAGEVRPQGAEVRVRRYAFEL